MNDIIPTIKVYLLYKIITPEMYGCQRVVGVFCKREEAEKRIFELSNKFTYRVEERVLQ